MTLRVTVCGLLLVLAAVLEVSVASRLGLPGASPDLVLLVVVGFALRWRSGAGAAIGFAGGLLLDLSPPADGTPGRAALVLTVVGYLVGLAVDAVSESLLLAAGTVVVAAAGWVVGFWALGVLVGDPRSTTSVLVRTLPWAVLYDLLLAPFVGWVVVRVARRVDPPGSVLDVPLVVPTADRQRLRR